MKTASQYLIALVLSAIAGWFILFQIQSVKRAVNALEEISSDVKIIRYNLAPASAMIGESPPEKVVLPEESPKDITL